ncbi:MAG: DUF2807 domain-containing protein [Anaeromyxobacter sp.]
MVSRSSALLALAGAFTLAGCDPWVVGDGVYHEETRAFPSFVGVAVQDGLDVEVTASASSQTVKVSGDENVVPHVKTEVVNEAGLGQTLQVKTDVAHLDSTHPLRIAVAVPVLSHVRAIEAANVEVSQAAAQSFDVHAGDGAEVHLSGAGGKHLAVTLWGGTKGGATLHGYGYVVSVDATVDLTDGAVAELHADGPVSGTVKAGAVLENAGDGLCTAVVTSGGGTVSCHP